MRIAGIDEAGRGAIAGPLVVSGFAVEDERLLEAFKRVGVKDSKKISAKKRAALCPFLLRRGSSVVKFIYPEEIDRYVLKQVPGQSLNYLEAIYMARVIDDLRPDVVYVDSPYVNINRFWKDLRSLIKNQEVRIIPEHHADSKYTIVGAASIIGKVRRDEYIEDLKKEFGQFGSGYPSDRRTRTFLTDLVQKTGKKPIWARSSWSSWENWLSNPRYELIA